MTQKHIDAPDSEESPESRENGSALRSIWARNISCFQYRKRGSSKKPRKMATWPGTEKLFLTMGSNPLQSDFLGSRKPDRNMHRTDVSVAAPESRVNNFYHSWTTEPCRHHEWHRRISASRFERRRRNLVRSPDRINHYDEEDRLQSISLS